MKCQSNLKETFSNIRLAKCISLKSQQLEKCISQEIMPAANMHVTAYHD